MHTVDKCAICSRTHLRLLWDLPNFPLSETYGDYQPDFGGFDQALLTCADCGHVQLQQQLSPSMLYNSQDYNYSTAKSVSTIKRFDSLKSFVQRFSADKINTLVDIGGNDPSLLQHFDAAVKYLIDPSLSNNTSIDAVTYIPSFVEDIDFKILNADVVLCSHALEHIAEPVSFIQNLLNNTNAETQFFFEVPCFIKQVQALRFDAFFHQHYHYFYPETLVRLIEQNGGEVFAVDYNAYPTCGGAVMVAFKAKSSGSCGYKIPQKHCLLEPLERYFETARQQFLQLNEDIRAWIRSTPVVYGYGASLLLPVIFYHIGEEANKIHYIVDDDRDKQGIGYKNIANLVVCSAEKLATDQDFGLIITSYENIAKLSALLNDKYPHKLFKGFN